LVLGGGGAGARAAIAADDAGRRCLIVTKGPVAHSGATPMACPSYQAAAAMEDPRDSAETAFFDTSQEGRDLGDDDLIHALVTEATDRALDLERYGVKFRKTDGRFFQVTHPGQSFPRNLVIKGCGYSMMFQMRRELERRPGIALMEDAIATRLLVRDGRVIGAAVLDLRSGEVADIRAGAVIIATGGYPELWLRTDTTPELTGDGQALALAAGAELVDMEMMLWYPTCLTAPEEIAGTLVQYEGLVNPDYCGGAFLNARGDPFLPPGRLPVRDVMMKLMFTEIDEGRGTATDGLYIDLRQSAKPMSEIRRILRKLDSLPYHNLADLNIDIAEQPIEVAPATHYTLGGVRIDAWGRTSVPGLYACGEAAGNVHGANRTSGNALTETQVFGRRAGLTAAQEAVVPTGPAAEAPEVADERARVSALFVAGPGYALRPREVKQALKQVMHEHLGHHRDERGMSRALDQISELRRDRLPRVRVTAGAVFNYELQEALEATAMLDVAETVVLSGLERRESRGHHWRSDFPGSEPGDLRHTTVRRVGDRLQLGRAAVRRIDRSVLATEGNVANVV